MSGSFGVGYRVDRFSADQRKAAGGSAQDFREFRRGDDSAVRIDNRPQRLFARDAVAEVDALNCHFAMLPLALCVSPNAHPVNAIVRGRIRPHRRRRRHSILGMRIGTN